MFLMEFVKVVAEFVHEDMQKHKRPRLSVSETAHNTILQLIIRNAEFLKNLRMSIEIRRGNLCPKIIWPSMKKNRSSFFAMIKKIEAVILIMAC